MASNPFDQFDTTQTSGNPFDQFDENLIEYQEKPTPPKQEEGVLLRLKKAVVEHPLQAIPGAAEAIAAGTVGLGEEAVAGVAGLGTAAMGKGFTFGYEGTKKALEPVSKLIEPETEVGKASLDVLGLIPEGIHKAGEYAYEKTGSPLIGAGTEALGTAATFLLPKVLGKKGEVVKGKEVTKEPVELPKPRTDISPEAQTSESILSKWKEENTPSGNKEIEEPSYAQVKAKTEEPITPPELPTRDTIKSGETVTLYRGENAENTPNGQWWTTDKEHAKYFGDVQEVTLPVEDVLKHSVRGDTRGTTFIFENEGKRPLDLVNKASVVFAEGVVPKEVEVPKVENQPLLNLIGDEEFHTKGKQILAEQGEPAARKFIEAYRIANPTELELRGAEDVIHTTLKEVKVVNREASVFYKKILEAIPNEQIRSRVTRAIEGERSYDKILTDKEKQTLLYGTGKIPEGKKYPDTGLFGALEGMKKNLEKGKYTDKEGKLISKEAYEERIGKFEKQITELRDLPSEEHAIPIMEKIKQRFTAIGERAVKEGVMDRLRQNYVTHILDFSKSGMDKVQQQAFLDKIFNAPAESKLNRDFAQHRQYEFLRELEKAVFGSGVVVHTDIATIMHAYESSMNTAILQKGMISKLKSTKDVEGKPYIVPVSEQALKDGYKPFQSVGSKPLEGLLVHPALADAMGFMFKQADSNMFLRSASGVTHLTKSLNTVGSLFHAKSLFEAGLLTDPVHTLKEMFTGYAGSRAAFKSFDRGGEEMGSQWLRDGLVVEVEDIQKSIIANTGEFLDKMADTAAKKVGVKKEQTPGKYVQRITDPIDQIVIQRLNKVTWDYMHAGQKLNMANNLLAKFKIKNPEASPEVVAATRKEIANYVNNTFGGVDWMGISKEVEGKYAKAFAMKAANIQGREWAQIVLFAPDWTVSTLRAFTNALPKELAKPQNWQLREGVKGVYNPKTSGDLARRYVLTTAIAWATLLNGINYATSGHSIWDNEDPTRIDMGDGTTIQAAKHSMEAVHWMQHPTQTAGNKLGFLPKSLFIGFTGTTGPSPNAPKLQDTSIVGRGKAIATAAAPFQVSSVIGAPRGEGVKRAAMSTLGLPMYGHKKDIALSAEERVQRRIDKVEKRREKIQKRMEGK